MTFDLDLDSVMSEFDGCKAIELSAIIKEAGKFNPSLFNDFNKSFGDQVDNLPDELLGIYLGIASVINYTIENVAFHGGDEISLSLMCNSSKIFVTVADNGSGFNVSKELRAFNNPEEHYFRSGVGFQLMSDSRAKIGFNSSGNKIFIYSSIDSTTERYEAKNEADRYLREKYFFL